jgi:hydrogenase nickel incorporation protein HypB
VAITEGEERPLKYPVMFRSADLVAVNRIDLLPHLDFDLDLFRANLRKVNPEATTIDNPRRVTSHGRSVDPDNARPARN